MSFNENSGRYQGLISNINPANHTRRIRLHQKENEVDIHRQQSSSRLGLKLKRTPSFMKELEQLQISQERPKNSSKSDVIMHEKRKASNFPISFLQIGQWQKISMRQGHLTAKIYFAKKQLVWEILEGSLKKKIEILWSDISAIRATILENEPAILEIALSQAPLFRGEVETQPRKHTHWEDTFDFTGGQASTWRIHVVQFPPGSLDENYEKLLQSDPRLYNLSQKPFPSQMSPYFQLDTYSFSQLSCYRDREPPYRPEPQYIYDQNHDVNPSTPVSGFRGFSHGNELSFNSDSQVDRTPMLQPVNYNQNYSANHVEQHLVQSHSDTSVSNQQATIFDEIKNDLFNDSTTYNWQSTWSLLDRSMEGEVFPSKYQSEEMVGVELAPFPPQLTTL